MFMRLTDLGLSVRRAGHAVLLTSASLTAVATFSAHALELRPGLWEQTMTMETSGAPPLAPEVLAKMSPAQRAKAEAALGAQGPRTTKVQSCITKEQLAEQNKDPFSGLSETGMTCKRQVKANTSTRMETHLECTGTSTMVADATMEAPDNQSMKGSTQMVRTVDGKPTNMKVAFAGKWLGSDCGDKAEDAKTKAK